MKGNYKVRVRVPIYASAVVEHIVYDAENEEQARVQAIADTKPFDVAYWFQHEWKPRLPFSALAEVIEFEATEIDTTKEEGK